MKKEILRKCVVSNEIKEKNLLFRVVLTPSKDVVIDMTGKLNGRGAYISKSKDIILEGKKKDVLSRALKTKVSEEIYDELIAKLWIMTK